VRVVFLGDSLTEGLDGVAYLPLLRERTRTAPCLREVELLNAGTGGDTVVNLARRLARDVAPLDPDWVVVFVGVNDATTLLLRRRLPTPATLRSRRYFRDTKGLRGVVTPERFAEGLRIVVEGLRARTHAQVALCTPAALGESLNARAWRLLDRYAAAVRQVADERGCPLIDVHHAFTTELATLPSQPPWRRLVALRPRWQSTGNVEALARLRGLHLTYDGIHLTRRGAELVADALSAWLAGAVAPPNAEGGAGERPAEAG
jgi:lysophospholipase L1-like esterase